MRPRSSRRTVPPGVCAVLASAYGFNCSHLWWLRALAQSCACIIVMHGTWRAVYKYFTH